MKALSSARAARIFHGMGVELLFSIPCKKLTADPACSCEGGGLPYLDLLMVSLFSIRLQESEDQTTVRRTDVIKEAIIRAAIRLLLTSTAWHVTVIYHQYTMD